jgi:hypothetical protein
MAVLVEPAAIRKLWETVVNTALVQTFGINAMKRSGTLRDSCGENRVP